MKRFVIWLIVLLVLVGAGFMVWRMLMGPSEGIITNTPASYKTQAEPVIELEQYEGTYFSFAKPSNFVLRQPRADDTSNTNSLESRTFIDSGIVAKIVTVVITKLPSGRLEDDASYYMRAQKPDTYKLRTVMVGTEKVTLVENLKEFQLAAFWPHKQAGENRLMTFTISSVASDVDTTTEGFEAMLQSVKWR